MRAANRCSVVWRVDRGVACWVGAAGGPAQGAAILRTLAEGRPTVYDDAGASVVDVMRLGDMTKWRKVIAVLRAAHVGGAAVVIAGSLLAVSGPAATAQPCPDVEVVFAR